MKKGVEAKWEDINIKYKQTTEYNVKSLYFVKLHGKYHDQ